MADNQLYPLSLPDYIPQSLNVSFEAAARDVWQTQCTRIKQAIETAYSLQEARNDDSTCLKIFVVPEFYFHLALIVNSKISYFLHPYALDIITQLRIIVQDKKYENWLFIFGSILTLGQPVSSWRSLTFLNTTLFQQGGVNPEKDQARVAINGMFVDLTDSNRSRLYTVTPLKALRTADVAAMFKDKPRQQVEDDQSWYWDDLKFTALKAKDIFKLSGVTFGLNCSLDETFAEGAQVQIVFSSGSEKFDSVNPSQNGQFFVIDGSSTPGSKFISANQSLEAIKTLTLEHPAQNRYLAIKEPGQLQIYAPQELDSSTNETNST